MEIAKETSIDDIWKIAEEAYEEINEPNSKCKSVNNCNNCNHKYENNICIKCGFENFLIGNAEWNNYRDQSTGEFSKSTQRADVYVDDNPYATTGTVLPFSNRSLIGRLQIQQTFSHKQKTYWQTGNYIEQTASLLNLNKEIVDSAKNYWHIYMESGKLTRASVRQGLIAACLFHSCISNKIPIERDEIMKAFNCTTKTLSKGEKVLYEILNNHNSSAITGILIEDSNSFVRYCNQLNLKYSVSHTCNNYYVKYKVELQAVTPKSAIGGILAFVVKNVLKQKNPTKTVISATVDICTPTLNKVLTLIEKLENIN